MVSDLQAAVDHYVEQLGFSNISYWGESAEYARLHSPCFEFWHNPGLAAQLANHSIAVYVANIEADYEKHRASGAEIVEDLAQQAWGSRTYVVEDPNGYRLRFGSC